MIITIYGGTNSINDFEVDACMTAGELVEAFSQQMRTHGHRLLLYKVVTESSKEVLLDIKASLASSGVMNGDILHIK